MDDEGLPPLFWLRGQDFTGLKRPQTSGVQLYFPCWIHPYCSAKMQSLKSREKEFENKQGKKKRQRYPTKWRKQVPTSCWALGSGCKHSSTTFRNSLWTARISSILENNICKIKTEIKTGKSACEANLKFLIKKPRRTQHLKQIATPHPRFLLPSKQKSVSSGLLFSHRTLGMGTSSWNSGKGLRDKPQPASATLCPECL